MADQGLTTLIASDLPWTKIYTVCVIAGESVFAYNVLACKPAVHSASHVSH